MFNSYKVLATILLVLISNVAFGDERPEVEVECRATEQRLEFICIFNVKSRKSGKLFLMLYSKLMQICHQCHWCIMLDR